MAETPDATRDADDVPPREAASAQDEVKRRYAEALAAKKARTAGGGTPTDRRGGSSRAKGPVDQRREFRRKSGG